MSRSKPDGRLVKIHRSYSVEEAAGVLKVHKHTVRGWLKKGLAPIDDRFPILIHGQTLRTFLDGKRRSSRTKCPPGHFYCLRCRAPRLPAEGMADYAPISRSKGMLTAICPDCETIMNRLTSATKLTGLEAHLAIAFPQGRERINGSS